MPAKTSTPEAVTSTLCYYRDAEIISKVAGWLGENAEQKKYAALAEKIADPFNKRFLDPETGIYANGSQTSLAAPLFFGVTKEEDRAKVIEKLLASIKSNNDHIMFGDIAPWMSHALAGIKIGAPGFKPVIIEPYPVEDLTFAKATVDPLRGPITSD